MSTTRIFLLLMAGVLFSWQAQGQEPVDTISTPTPPEDAQQVIEDFLQNTDSEGDFDFNTLFENLEIYRRRPLNINKATEEELRDLHLLSDAQILNLINYRRTAGALVAIYELQAIPGFDLPSIRRLVPFVTVGADAGADRSTLSQMLTQGRNELYLRWSRVLEQQKGFIPLAPGDTSSRYLGDPNQLYIRFKHSYGNRLSFGFTAEKDRGEEFFKGNNQQGFDFYSAHLFIRDLNPWLKELVLGDYSVSMGQGLILFTGFAPGKSSMVTSIKRSARTLRQYNSVNEVLFLRGAAATIKIIPSLEWTFFGSYRQRDANLIEPDPLSADAEERLFTSLGTSGLHRTPNEIADENAIQQWTAGTVLKYKLDRLQLGFNALYNKLDGQLQRTTKPYNLYYFNGDELTNYSLDYSYIFRNFNFFGETAMSDNGAIATLNGLLIGLDRHADLAVLFRHFPRDYQALDPNPFAETDGARNETGLYLGLELRPWPQWIISTYFDAWRHPWLRFTTDAPSRGTEFRLRLTYFQKRRYEVYLEVRNEVKDDNVSRFDYQLDLLEPTQTFLTRLNWTYQLSKALEWRSRIDVGFSDNDINSLQKGMALYQDLLFHPIGFPVSFTTRFAIFDTDGFQARFYSYENDLLYTFSIPPYYNRGTRFYFNIRYRPIKPLTIEARYAQTYWADQKTIGSSLDEINGQARSQVSAQIRYTFGK